jgi:hypothetical protein
MIFLAAGNEPTMFLMLFEKDIQKIHRGETLYVDRSATGGYKFDKVVVGWVKDQQAAADILKKAGHKPPEGLLPEPQPTSFTDERCMGCKAIKTAWEVYEGKCIYCWHKLCMELQGQRN